MKNDGTYFIAIYRGEEMIDKVYPEKVYPFKYMGQEFFVHLLLRSNHYVPYYNDKQWSVTEKITGLAIVGGFDDRATAKVHAKQTIDKYVAKEPGILERLIKKT